MKKRFVLFTKSSTQRVVANVNNSDVLLSKEWRKSYTDEWKVGKGIDFSAHHIIGLSKVLESKNDAELNTLLSQYEILPEA